MDASETADAARHRWLLEELLRPITGSLAPRHAEHLLHEFGSLDSLLAAEPDALLAALGDDSMIADRIQLVRAIMLDVLRPKRLERPVLASSQALRDYLRVAMAWAPVEQFRVLYLNAANQLLRDEVASSGTVDHVSILPREIIRRAIYVSATAVIVVHNHPAGNASPSSADVVASRRLVDLARGLGVDVHDHIVISATGYRSFREEGLL